MLLNFVSNLSFLCNFIASLNNLNRKRKAEDEPDTATKKIKKEKSVDDDTKKIQKKQSEKIFYYRDKLSNLKKPELQDLLYYNKQNIPVGQSVVSILFLII